MNTFLIALMGFFGLIVLSNYYILFSNIVNTKRGTLIPLIGGGGLIAVTILFGFDARVVFFGMGVALIDPGFLPMLYVLIRDWNK